VYTPYTPPGSERCNTRIDELIAQFPMLTVADACPCCNHRIGFHNSSSR
jgi:hypothetical protein